MNSMEHIQAQKITVLVLAAVLVVGIAGMLFFRFYVAPAETESSGEALQEEIYNVTGTVEEVQGSTIKLKAEKVRNNFKQDRVYTISVNAETKITSVVGEEGQNASGINEVNPGLSLIRIGDSLNVATAEDINQIESFTALEIFNTKDIRF